MAGPITAVAQPVQLHAQGLQVAYRRGVLRVAAQQAGGSEAEAFACGSQGVQVVGVVTAEAYQARGACAMGMLQVVAELEPLVAADQRINQVQAQDGGFNLGFVSQGRTRCCSGG